ncbi:MAG: hypothetical protein II208_03680, partial [Alphaproteobacteria bacterium]|nr:hypothetical protein [Alphaproteobacteria bacterium]
NIATAQQKFIIQIDDKTLKRIKPHDRAELVNAYLQLFSGFSWVNWTNGHSLGRAWQTTITQCGAFCESKNKKNPAAKYLNAAYNGHKKYWSQIIMTHKNRENTINQKDEHIKKLREHGMRMIRQAMDKINLILARYNEYTLEINRSTTAEMETPSAPHTNQSQNNNSQSPNPHTPAQQGLPKTDATRPAPEHAMAQKQAQTAEIAQQKQQPQKVAEPQRVAQPAQLKQAQAAEIPQQKQQPQKVAEPQRVAQPAQLKQTQSAEIAQQKQQPQKVAEPQRMAQPTQQKQPYVQPMATIVRPVQPKKTYAAPEMSVRENQFAKSVQQTKTEPKATKFVAAQMQIKRQINIFAFKNFNQHAA